MATQEFIATGKRKTAIARVRLRAGKGIIKVNNREVEDYFGRATLPLIVQQPFTSTETKELYDVSATLTGGGTAAQAEALRHGISRALIQVDAAYRKALKAAGYLTRDPRVVERKKYGQPKARRRFQFSKR